MDSFNKVISFILGLVVVIVFFLVLSGKINLKSKLASNGASATPTPISTVSKSTDNGFFNLGAFLNQPTVTPTPTSTQNPTTISSITVSGNNTYNQVSPSVKTGKTIPSTGLPTLFIPALFSGLMGGSFLRKTGKRKG